MFINRHQELAALNRMFRSETAELFVLYDRRRVGKTEILLQFCKDKRSIYFLASQLKEQDHLRQLTETARHVINDPLLQSIIFDDWESALIYFAQQAEGNGWFWSLMSFNISVRIMQHSFLGSTREK